jgi:hypothetical protein
MLGLGMVYLKRHKAPALTLAGVLSLDYRLTPLGPHQLPPKDIGRAAHRPCH